jgi:hypothetical protein
MAFRAFVFSPAFVLYNTAVLLRPRVSAFVPKGSKGKKEDAI